MEKSSVPIPTTADELHEMYERLTFKRSSYLNRAREAAKLTIPFLMPPDGFNSSQELPTPHQSIGALGLNNLANLLLSSAFPPNTPFHRMAMDDATVRELAQNEKARAGVEEKLNEIERQIHLRVTSRVPRTILLYYMQQLIAAGNALMIAFKKGVRVYRLDNYVVQRDGSGNPLLIIAREMVDPMLLPEKLQESLKKLSTTPSHDETSNAKDVTVYTAFKRVGNKLISYQTVKGLRVPGSEGSWPVERAPIIAGRWSWQDGEDYGRGYIEQFIGDLQAAEGLSKAIRDASAAAAKVVILVAPNGTTREIDIAEAENLDVRTGRADDVTMLRLDKSADMQIAKATLDGLEKRLSQAFVMFLGVRRDAERVTADETRQVVNALEGALGGTYALFAQELQLPLVRIAKAELEDEGLMPKVPTGNDGRALAEPVIVTGVEALGRGEDFSRYQTFITTILQLLGPAAVEFINIPDFIKRTGTSLSIDMDGLIKTREEIEAEKAQLMEAQQQQLVQQTVGKMAEKAAGPAATAMLQQQGQPTE